jgi:hypothetical protein
MHNTGKQYLSPQIDVDGLAHRCQVDAKEATGIIYITKC